MPKNQGYDADKGTSAFGNMKRMLKNRGKKIDEAVDQAQRGNEVHVVTPDYDATDDIITQPPKRRK